MIRPATLNDIDALVAIENQCFGSDLLTRRSFRYLLTKGHANTLLEERDGRVCGYAMALFSGGTSMSPAVFLGRYTVIATPGIGLQLSPHRTTAKDRIVLHASGGAARQHARQNLFRKSGYKQFGPSPITTKTTWMRCVREIVGPHLTPDMVRVPYFQQSLDFTCGPASV